MPDRADAEREALEISLLLEGVHQHYGFDFRQYARASLRRRLWRRVYAEGLTTISGLQERVLHDRAAMERLLLDLSINVTSMFRDPGFFAAFRQHVVPALRTYPFLRIWNAGCSTGPCGRTSCSRRTTWCPTAPSTSSTSSSAGT
jgi:chemotaxis protein methyltransferase CheR